MIDIKDPKECCGCTACVSICANDAIVMKPDVLGFLYPHVDKEKCVDCGLCEKVCQFNDFYDKSLLLEQPIAYAARHKDMNEIMKSRSGAAFVAISDHILNQGGVVYGAGYKDHFRVAHKRATTKDGRDEFRGSKYVQSDMTGVFRQVREDLKDGLIVLFSGTPCQTSGLNAFIGRNLRENLLLMDIVCQGVPSPYVWRDYIDYLEKKHGSRICYVNFRDKEKYGWKAHKETFMYENGGGKYTYTFLFHQDIDFRYSCNECHFANLQRPSDITIADYWGWQRTDPRFNADNRGCSLVLCNTEKGKQLFEDVKDRMNVIHAEQANVMQNHLSKPSDIHPKRMEFEIMYGKRGFEHTMRHFGFMGWRRKVSEIKKKMFRFLKKILRN